MIKFSALVDFKLMRFEHLYWRCKQDSQTLQNLKELSSFPYTYTHIYHFLVIFHPNKLLLFKAFCTEFLLKCYTSHDSSTFNVKMSQNPETYMHVSSNSWTKIYHICANLKRKFQIHLCVKKELPWLKKIGDKKRENVKVGFRSLPENGMETYNMYKIG